jgi:hypothetical protein
MTSLASWQPGFSRPAAAPPMQVSATTDLAGFNKVNGTPNILQWTAPNDSQMHRARIAYVQRVTSAETGGATQVTWTNPDGSGPASKTLGPGGGGAGTTSFDTEILVAPGTTVTLAQSSALTAGACILWAEIWGS